MRKLILAVCASMTLAGAAQAAINPAKPGLPIVTDPAFTQNVPNNQLSAMCVACHTRQPRPGGTHYVNTAMDGGTNSGGSGISNTGTLVTRDNGAFFKITTWNTNTPGATVYSMYGINNLSVAWSNTVPGTKIANQVSTAATYAGADIICESCHNIVVNQNGGNNLVCVQNAANAGINNFQAAATADICVGCHGFMYAQNAANTEPNYSANVNQNEVTTGAVKGNNEVHWIKGAPRFQNHHVMTNDNISSAKAAAGLLWTDNDIIAASVIGVANSNATRGTYPQRATWAAGFNKPNGFINCVNCHAPAHGGDLANGNGPASTAGSILRLTTGVTNANIYTIARANPWSRISDAASQPAFKKIDDRYFCAQCHQ